jgi:hypothetical protein
MKNVKHDIKSDVVGIAIAIVLSLFVLVLIELVLGVH